MYEGYTLVIDIDGTICPIKKTDEDYSELIPFSEMVQKIRECKKDGAKIVLFSSRNMNTFCGDLEKINAYTVSILKEWLVKWDIPYDELIMGKPWPGHHGFYVDDRSVRPDEFLSHTPEELESMCERSRCITNGSN